MGMKLSLPVYRKNTDWGSGEVYENRVLRRVRGPEIERDNETIGCREMHKSAS
jgi:hypothetical protein